jgi:hypothetical protein
MESLKAYPLPHHFSKKSHPLLGQGNYLFVQRDFSSILTATAVEAYGQ